MASTVVSVAALQVDIRRADPAANLATVLAGLEEAAAQGVRLVVLPEMWPTSFEHDADEDAFAVTERSIADVRDASRRLELVVVGSGYGRRDGALPTNRAHVIDRGELVATYDKTHLFSPTAESLSFSAGDAPPPVVETSVARLAPLVCYDLRFPELARAAFRAGAEVLVVSAQWPTTRARHWHALLRGRAVEGQWFVVAANRTGRDAIGRRAIELEFPGNSLVVSPDGEVLAEGRGAAGLVSAEIDLDEVRRVRRKIPIVRDERPSLYASWSVE